jgi:hypothetical protein
MRRFFQFLAIVALMAAPAVVGAQDIRINPVPPDLKPQWTQVPGAPQVSWAPNLPTDVFRYRGKYYFFWENYFYRSSAPQGPWKAVMKVPEVFYKVDPAYFKTPKKTGETPAAPGGAAPSTKAKIIDLPPAAPAAPEPPTAPAKPPKVM